MGLNRGFWRDRRVLVTGHTGFIGSWLGLALAQFGARVAGVALPPPTAPSHFDAARIEGELAAHHLADIRDAAELMRIVTAARPEIVFHLAAQPIVRTGYRDPVGTYATNVMGTVHLLEAARHCQTVQAVVVFTSDKVYENRGWAWGYRENDPLGGQDPYGSSKACCEFVIEAYRRAYFAAAETGPAVASVRAGNVVGGGDWAVDRLVPDAVRAFAAGRPLRLRHPEASRPWQHVLEPVHAALLLGERLLEAPAAAAGAWNIGPVQTDLKPVAWIADTLVRLWGGGQKWVEEPDGRLYEAPMLGLDSAKAQLLLGWHPHWPLEHALDRTVEWYRMFYSSGDVATLSREQLWAFGDGQSQELCLSLHLAKGPSEEFCQ